MPVLQAPSPARVGRRSKLDTAFRRWRESQGLTLRQLADLISEADPSLAATFGNVQNVEQNGTFDVRWIRALASALAVTPQEIEAETKKLREL